MFSGAASVLPDVSSKLLSMYPLTFAPGELPSGTASRSGCVFPLCSRSHFGSETDFYRRLVQSSLRPFTLTIGSQPDFLQNKFHALLLALLLVNDYTLQTTPLPVCHPIVFRSFNINNRHPWAVGLFPGHSSLGQSRLRKTRSYCRCFQGPPLFFLMLVVNYFQCIC